MRAPAGGLAAPLAEKNMTGKKRSEKRQRPVTMLAR